MHRIVVLTLVLSLWLVTVTDSSSKLPPIDGLHELAPVVNTGLLLLLLVVAILLFIQSKGWSAPTLKASIDQLYAFDAANRKSLKELHLDHLVLKREQQKLEDSFAILHARVVDADEQLHKISKAVGEVLAIVQTPKGV